jgi:hypothetical protein
MKKLPLIVLAWADHSSCDAWMKGEEVAEVAVSPIIHSVGWLHHETKTTYVLAASLCEDDGDVGQMMSIIKSAVIKKKVLDASFEPIPAKRTRSSKTVYPRKRTNLPVRAKR